MSNPSRSSRPSKPKTWNAEASVFALPPPYRVAMFLDIDGTLLDFAPHPGDVIADAELIALIGNIHRATDGAVAFVSGRSVADIDRIFAPLVLAAAGLHGAEMRLPDNSRHCTPSSLLDDSRPFVRAFVDANPGLLLEDKGATIAVHFRQRPELAEAVLQALQPFGSRGALEVLTGKFVAELKPRAHDKGGAIARLLALPPFAGRIPVFIGDDRTDEEGFEYVNQRGGFSVRIDPVQSPTNARVRIANPAALRRLLKEFVRSPVIEARA